VLPNLHALATYLKLVHALRIRFERFDECQCEDDDVHFFFAGFGSLVMDIIIGSRVE